LKVISETGYWERKIGLKEAYELFLDIIAWNITVVLAQDFGSFLEPPFAGEPPWGFGYVDKYGCHDSDHRPLEKLNQYLQLPT